MLKVGIHKRRQMHKMLCSINLSSFFPKTSLNRLKTEKTKLFLTVNSRYKYPRGIKITTFW